MKMSMQDNTAKYVELSSRTYELMVDTFASAARGRIDYWKVVWEIASRPYASRAIGAAVQENFDRTSELTNLTVSELHSRGQRAVDFSEKLLTQVGQLQDAALETYRDSSRSIGSTVGQGTDAATELSVDGVSTVDQSINGVKYLVNRLAWTNETQ
jgi:hypothetical protein